MLPAFCLALALLAPPAGSLDELTRFMVGRYTSAEQAKADPANFRDIRLEVVRVWPERTDGVWLYVEQAAAETLDKPYRQRVYRLTAPPEGSFRSEIFEFKAEPLKHAGAWRQAEPLKGLSPADLVARPGCAVWLAPDGKGAYRGATRAKECLSTHRGATYATTRVTVTASELQSWDQGWDATDRQVWGAEKGGYVFRKQP